MDREIVNNREPPDRGRVEAKWKVCQMLWHYRKSNVKYDMFSRRKRTDLESYIYNYIYYGLPSSYIYNYICYGLPDKIYFLDVPIDCESYMYGAKETQDYKYHKLKQSEPRKLSASLARQGEQHEGIFAVCDNSNGCCRVFDIKYHPPQRTYCLRDYGLNSTNEVFYVIAAVTSFQKSLLNIRITKEICMPDVSTTPDDGQLCGASSLPDGDEATEAWCSTDKGTCIAQVTEDDGDVGIDIDLSRQVQHQGAVADPAPAEQTAVQPGDTSDKGIHTQVGQKISKVKDTIKTVRYEGLRRFIFYPDTREPSPSEMSSCEEWLKANNRFHDTWKKFLQHWNDWHQQDEDVKRKRFQIGGVVYSLEHKFPYIFMVLILNILTKYGKCTIRLARYVRALLNSGPNLDVITEQENADNGKKCEYFINDYVKQKRYIWQSSFIFEGQEHLDMFLYVVKQLFEQNIEPNAQQYFKQSWNELISDDYLRSLPLSQPDEFADFVRTGKGIFG